MGKKNDDEVVVKVKLSKAEIEEITRWWYSCHHRDTVPPAFMIRMWGNLEDKITKKE